MYEGTVNYSSIYNTSGHLQHDSYPLTTSEHVTAPPEHVTSPPQYVTVPSEFVTTTVGHVTEPPEHVTAPPEHGTVPPERVRTPPEHITTVDTSVQPPKIAKKGKKKRKRFLTEDIKAACLVPLKDGWTREIRLRYNSPTRADIYYFSPDGTRFRSTKEIEKFLEENGVTKYTLKQFSFYHEPLGGECAPYEVVRQNQSKSAKKSGISEFDIDRNTLITIPPSAVASGEITPLPGTKAKKTPKLKKPQKPRNPLEFDIDRNTLITIPPSTVASGEITPLPGTKAKKTPKLKKRQKPRNPLDPVKNHNPSDNLYCICTDVAWGPMVSCSNERCVLKLYHLPCVGLKEVPLEHQLWYCPICRDWNPETLNPMYAIPGGV